MIGAAVYLYPVCTVNARKISNVYSVNENKQMKAIKNTIVKNGKLNKLHAPLLNSTKY